MESKYFVLGMVVFVISFAAGWAVVESMNSSFEKTNTDGATTPASEQSAQNSQPTQNNELDVVDELLADEDSINLGSVLDPDTPGTPTSTPAPTKPSKPTSGITSSQLAAHNSRTNCWVAYKGTVYDITSFLPKHPGGVSTISPYCGTADGFASAFNKQHKTKQDSRLAREGKVMGAYIA